MYILNKMSYKIDKKTCTEKLDIIKAQCHVVGRANKYGPTEFLDAYGETANSLYVPFAYAKNKFKVSPNKETQFPITKYSFNDKKFPFRTDGRRDQEVVFNDALKLLKKHRTVLLSLHCGYGKTYLAIRLAHACGLKCAVLAHRGILFDQWVQSIKAFTSAKVQLVDTDGILEPTADFYIFNIAFVHKLWDKKTQSWGLKKLGLYKNIIGLLIVDEAHIACAQEMSRALLYFNPRMMIALTATPIRADGMDKALELYFGSYKITRIIRIASDPFTVYKLNTKITPPSVKTVAGRKDWNAVISYLVEDSKRNKIILDLILKFNTYNIILLTKRTNHCNYLSDKLTKLKVTNTVMVGTDTEYDKTARVLLSTYSKLGVGFDDSRLNMLIVACPVKEIEQYAGRLRDAVNKKRIIIDMVDNDSNCKSQWDHRRKWYISRNGNISNYNESTQTTESESKEPLKRLARKIN
jgi:superfamily II DNA or RNA helicase